MSDNDEAVCALDDGLLAAIRALTGVSSRPLLIACVTRPCLASPLEGETPAASATSVRSDGVAEATELWSTSVALLREELDAEIAGIVGSRVEISEPALRARAA